MLTKLFLKLKDVLDLPNDIEIAMQLEEMVFINNRHMVEIVV